ncbi:MAG: DNA topoisomerase I, partial [Leptolyngbya sp. SIO4C5]|nr:DNA topoisomerase I [Leptolyngbya sp. SIO4C5]
METTLDAIAAGQQEWQSYLIGWHQSYFAPSPAPPQASKAQVSQIKPSNAKPSKTQCPTCSQLMDKIPSRSKKLKAKHFL